MSVELANESRISSLTNSMSAMYVHGESSNSKSNRGHGRYQGVIGAYLCDFVSLFLCI